MNHFVIKKRGEKLKASGTSFFTPSKIEKSYYIDEVLVMNDGTNDYYYGTDHLYSPVVLFESDGDVIERYEYNAYGKAHVYNGDFSQSYSASQVGNPYLFTGRRVDMLDGGSLILQYNRYNLETIILVKEKIFI